MCKSINVYYTDAIFLSDDLFIARSLKDMYKENARVVLANYPEQYVINELKEVENVVLIYGVCYKRDGMTPDFKDEIWHIYSETLSGLPNFPCRWSLFDFLFESGRTLDHEYWTDFIECRRNLYNYLKPIIKELPVYYHA